MTLLPEEVSHGASHLGVVAHTAAFRDGGGWLDQLLTGLTANRALLEQLLAQHLPAVGYIRPEGTYLAWLDCTPLRLDTDPMLDGPVVSDIAGPARYFLNHARVALSSGRALSRFHCVPCTTRTKTPGEVDFPDAAAR